MGSVTRAVCCRSPTSAVEEFTIAVAEYHPLTIPEGIIVILTGMGRRVHWRSCPRVR